MTKFASGAAALFAENEPMNSILKIARTVRGFRVMLVLGTLLTHVHAQPRISMNIQRLDFKGNLLRLTDGGFVAEKKGQLYRLTPDARFERKLEFDPTRPFASVTGGQTGFSKLLAPLKSGGFLASVNFYIPGFGWIERRLASFDADGRLVSSFDTSGTSIGAAIESPDGQLLYTRDNANLDNAEAAIAVQPTDKRWFYGTGLTGYARGLAVQGSNVVVGGILVNRYGFPFATETNGLLRLNATLIPDSSFRPPRCKDVSQLAVQSDGRIIAWGQLANAQGVFETNTTVFRLNAAGSLERRFLQVPADDWRQPAFALGRNDEIMILHAGEFYRYNSDGSLVETGRMGNGWPFEYFDEVKLLPDGSFLAHYFNGDAGGCDVFSHHWVAFKPNGQLDPSFPPSPLNYVRTYLSVTNTLARHSYDVEQSNDLIAWEDAGISYGDSGAGSIEGIRVGPCEFRLEETRKPQFFRVVEVRDF